jgi:hypothetical protein
VLEEVAERFCPPYERAEPDRKRPGITLHDPSGRRPSIVVRHRYEKRLFLRANYLSLSAAVAGVGPHGPAELEVKLRGPLSRQHASVRWKTATIDGDSWMDRFRDPMLAAVQGVEAVQSLSATWAPKRREWSVRLETMSGSMVSGMMAGMPIAVPFEAREAEAFMELVEAFVEAARVKE